MRRQPVLFHDGRSVTGEPVHKRSPNANRTMRLIERLKGSALERLLQLGADHGRGQRYGNCDIEGDLTERG